jgi:hypothetical protein
MLLFQLANWVWGEARGDGPSDAVDGEPCSAVFGGEPVGEMIEVLSRRPSLCETWRYFGAMTGPCYLRAEQRKRDQEGARQRNVYKNM